MRVTRRYTYFQSNLNSFKSVSYQDIKNGLSLFIPFFTKMTSAHQKIMKKFLIITFLNRFKNKLNDLYMVKMEEASE